MRKTGRIGVAIKIIVGGKTGYFGRPLSVWAFLLGSKHHALEITPQALKSQSTRHSAYR